MNIYVGNLNYTSTEDSLRQVFEKFGEVKSVKVIEDRETGRPRGFGFVEMANDEDGKKAIEALDGKDVDGRPIRVNEAKPKTGGDRPGGGGGGGRSKPPRRQY